jgi:hypothetical protein
LIPPLKLRRPRLLMYICVYGWIEHCIGVVH